MKVKQSNTLLISEFRTIYKDIHIEDKDNSDIEVLITTLTGEKGHISLDNILVLSEVLNTKSSPMFSLEYIVSRVFNLCRKSIRLVEEVEVEEVNSETIEPPCRTDGDSHITVSCNMKDCTFYGQNKLYKCCGTTSCGHYEKKTPIEIL